MVQFAIGGPLDYNLNDVGYVRVFEYSSGSWSQRGEDIYGEAVMGDGLCHE